MKSRSDFDEVVIGICLSKPSAKRHD